MQFDVVTIFPRIIQEAAHIGLLGRAIQDQLLTLNCHDLRDYTQNPHRRVDDSPYGGGPGMVMQVEPMVRALEAATQPVGRIHRVLLSPRGNLLTQKKVRELAECDQLILLCGRYEGVDERISAYVDEELSIGDYVLSGGEFAALVVIDAIARLLPGVVGEPSSLIDESHAEGLLEYPQYTRPPEFRGLKVPEVLLGGNHQEIERWRREQAEALTRQRRPDLLKKS